MGFRFSRRMTLFPGVRLNFSSRGISTTIGVPGASINFGANGPTLNFGIPGTGLSYKQHLGTASERPDSSPPPSAPPQLPPEPLAAPERPAYVISSETIGSAPVSAITSEGLAEFKALITKAMEERSTLQWRIPEVQHELNVAEKRLRRAKNWFFGLFLKRKVPERTAAVEQKKREVEELTKRAEGAFVSAEFDLDQPTLKAFDDLTAAFQDVAGCECIWDITDSEVHDRRITRASASTVVSRVPVQFSMGDDSGIIESAHTPLRLYNANGADLLIFAGIVLMPGTREFGLIDLRDVKVEFSSIRFTERDRVPCDAQVIGQTWAKCNKDGSPDRRFKDNYQIPVVYYGEITLRTSTGVYESYEFSSHAKAQRFANALVQYQNRLRALPERPAARALPV
jgi:hypothetical protein